MLDILRLSQVAIEYDPYQLAAQFLGRSEEVEKYQLDSTINV